MSPLYQFDYLKSLRKKIAFSFNNAVNELHSPEASGEIMNKEMKRKMNAFYSGFIGLTWY